VHTADKISLFSLFNRRLFLLKKLAKSSEDSCPKTCTSATEVRCLSYQNNNDNQMKMRNEFKKGDSITYTREVMFKGSEKVTSKIVAIGRTSLLLENGDQISVF
jgi:hypothetical protein